ncbi:aminoglycoside phosphotransferase family protein [Manganibacter manganicus]|uniref:3'-kinase n=1 Tax=Manganibacter manganicus TaxID=1873176 RepID=A0A1V8RWN1_9HYPH|nr:aminoglycoside phosphotransferase family protein [Pseudaminobacter manganicus]OQM77601.1 3'-kinase [Pseudaminobacter manganicus]
MTAASSFPASWNADNAILIAETFSSRIFKVRLADSTPAIVKALKPFDDAEDELRGAHLLAWRDGVGAVRILAQHGRNMLLEYAGETMLTHVLQGEGDNAASEIAAEVMAKLHSASSQPVPPDLQPLRERFRDLFAKAQADDRADRKSLYGEAASLAKRLLSNQDDIRPLHGDLHHENIMHGRRGWLAIDPKGVLGDPCFDAANMLYNPLDRDDLCLDPTRIADMTKIFSRRLGLDPRRLLDFAFCYGCLSAAWHASDGNDTDENRELAVAAAISRVRALNF